MPLIRYEIGDISVKLPGFGSSGKKMERLERIDGRMDDILVTDDGRQVPPVNFYTMFQKFPNIDFFKIHQIDRGNVNVYIVSNSFSKDQEGELLQQMKLRVGEKINYQVELVDEIEKNAFGKFRCVQSEISPT
jgi:phenylacetate-CoA ligase